jgi:hypothetical protein
MSLTINELVELARLHFNHLQADITNASNRIEHIRLTTLTQEAANLLTNLENFAAGSTGSEELIPVQLLTNGAAINLPGNSSGCCGGSGSCACGN